MSDSLIPNTEVYENGKQIPNARVDPNVAQFLMQAAATSQLVRLRKLEERKVPIGVLPLTLNLNDSVMNLSLSMPWISFSLINDGPGIIFVAINDPGKLHNSVPQNVNEIVNIDMTYPVITNLYMVTSATGTIATVRIHGVEGKWELS